MPPTTDIQARIENLAELRSQTLKVLVSICSVIGYAWLIVIVWPIEGWKVFTESAIGCAFLLIGTMLSFVLRRRYPAVISYLVIVGILAAITSVILTFDIPSLHFLFVLPIVLGSVLLSPLGMLAVTTLSGLLVATINFWHLLIPWQSINNWLPILVLFLVGTTSWISVHNLYTALDWVWHAYERATENEARARDGQAELRRVLKTLDETTYRLERVNYALVLARDQAEEALKIKQEFARTISHELRTPLNLIEGFTEMMTQNPEYYDVELTPNFTRDLMIVYRNARHLHSLLNDVLDLARIEAAQLVIIPEETDPATLVQEVVSTARSLIDSRGLTLHVIVEPDLPHLWLDPTRIRQVLINLLSNATRFTEQGNITIHVYEEADKVVFSVADTGIGIAPADLSRVFEEFRQLDSSGTRRRNGGAGLGLSISQRFVELHGGRIWVESETGKGSTFYFALPVGRPGVLPLPVEVLQPVANETTNSGIRRAPRRLGANLTHDLPLVLVVTSSSIAASLLTQHIRGGQTFVVHDLEQARLMASRLLPQVVLLDEALLDASGLDLVNLPQSWGLPLSYFLASPLPSEEPVHPRLRVDGYLVKPVSRDSLWSVLRQFGEDIDRVLIADEDPDFVRMLDRQLSVSSRRYQVTAAYSGAEAVELARRQQPHLALLSLNLPDALGMQLVEQFRTDESLQRCRIVAISAQDEFYALRTLSGTLRIAREGGLQPSEVVRWVQQGLREASRASPTRPRAH